jgi:putative Mg2+ transporter-C (MgtC) family protein
MSPEIESVLRLLLAAGLGAIIGFQREKANKPAGLRTHILICMGSALFTIVSIYGFGGTADPARIAAGVVTGVGFLGAGAIMQTKASVRGLTTAASLWTVAGIGLAVGCGFYFAAVGTTGLVFIALVMFSKVEDAFSLKGDKKGGQIK